MSSPGGKANVIRKAKGGDAKEAKQKGKPGKRPSPSPHVCTGRQRRRGSAVKKPRRQSAVEGSHGARLGAPRRPAPFDRTNPGWRQPPAQRAFETPPGLESGSSPFSHVCAGRQRRRAAARIGRPVAQPEYNSRGSARAGKTSRRGLRGFGIPSPTEPGQTLRAGRRQAQASQGRGGPHWETRHDEPALSGGRNGSHEGTSNSAIKPPLRHRHRSLSSIPAERGPFAGPNGAGGGIQEILGQIRAVAGGGSPKIDGCWWIKSFPLPRRKGTVQ